MTAVPSSRLGQHVTDTRPVLLVESGTIGKNFAQARPVAAYRADKGIS